MPTINQKKICTVHGLYSTKKCTKCTASYNKNYEITQRDHATKAIYKTSKWQRVRMIALIRDNFLCVECKKNGIDTPATEVHHVVEISVSPELAYNLDNLASICRKCHLKTHRS